MDHAVRRVLEIVLSATGSEIAVGVPVALHVAVDSRGQRKAPDIELPIFIQKWPLDVLLNNVTPLVAIHLLVLDQRLDMVEVSADLDTTPPVGVFARLDDPQ